MKLTKKEIELHQIAEHLISKPGPLEYQDKLQIIENYREDAKHINSKFGAFFTPYQLAIDATQFVEGRKILDLCAGIGTLSFVYFWEYVSYMTNNSRPCEVTCVEINPDYVEIGKKLLPEARWLCMDVLEAVDLLKTEDAYFDTTISNPPFGNNLKHIELSGKWRDELKIVELGSLLADHGVFILPSESAPKHEYVPVYTENEKGKRKELCRYGRVVEPDRVKAFSEKTGIKMNYQAIETERYAKDWHGVSPKVTVVQVDYKE